ncbi:hypothetical protein ABZS77_22450 [Micromonospora sp. NPDC005298]|uniref:hypothetical protein n=1 Tax=Micromonospora sp. NPDC005298 TaxID=3156873 RepID=UPI0033B8CEFA
MPEPEPVRDDNADADTSATADTSDADTSATAETDLPAVPANRAARRAKGKGASPQPQGKGQHFGGRGSVQSPRQWGNRRSG